MREQWIWTDIKGKVGKRKKDWGVRRKQKFKLQG